LEKNGGGAKGFEFDGDVLCGFHGRCGHWLDKIGFNLQKKI